MGSIQVQEENISNQTCIGAWDTHPARPDANRQEKTMQNLKHDAFQKNTGKELQIWKKTYVQESILRQSTRCMRILDNLKSI